MKTLIKCPLPGKLLEYKVKEGDKISRGDVVAIVESMKMHNEILSEEDGIIRKLISLQDEHIPANGDLVEIEKI